MMYRLIFLAFLINFGTIHAQDDTDADGIPDFVEQMYFGGNNGVDDWTIDTDSDGFSDGCEVYWDVTTNVDFNDPSTADTDIWQDSDTFPPSNYNCSDAQSGGSGGGGSGGGDSGGSSNSCNHPLEADIQNSTITAVPSQIDTSLSDVSDRTVTFYVFVRDTNNDLYPCQASVTILFNGEQLTLTAEENSNGPTGIYTATKIFNLNEEVLASASFNLNGETSSTLAIVSANPSSCVIQSKELYLGFDGRSLWSGSEPNDADNIENGEENAAEFLTSGGMNDQFETVPRQFVIRVNSSQTPPNTYTYLGAFYSSRFYISNGTHSWSNANSTANLDGYSLIDIKGPEEYYRLLSLTSNLNIYSFWTGLSQNSSSTALDEGWEWLDGTPLDGGINENETVQSINLNDYFENSNLSFSIDQVYPRSSQTNPQDGDNLTASISNGILSVNLVQHKYGESSIAITVSNSTTGCTEGKTFKINVVGDPNPPTDFQLSDNEIAENTTGFFSISVTDNDSDAHTFEFNDTENFPDNSNFSLTQEGLSYSTAFNFEQPLDQNSDNSYSIKLRVNDSQLDDNGNYLYYDKTFTITVLDGNDKPVVQELTATTDFETAVDVSLSGSDEDNDSLTYIISTNPTNGSASISDNILTYTPNNSFSGDDTVGYLANDGTENGDEKIITITVNENTNATDSDNDGISDVAEGYNSSDPSASTDSDGDGVADYLESNTADEDGDGTTDHLDGDNDTDGDGYTNIDETNGGSDPLDPDSTLGVNDNEIPIYMSIHPNPTIDKINISTNLNESLNIIMFDMSGKRVIFKELDFETKIDVGDLKTGVYILKVFSSSKSSMFRVIKK